MMLTAEQGSPGRSPRSPRPRSGPQRSPAVHDRRLSASPQRRLHRLVQAEGQAAEAEVTEVFVDPVTARVLGQRSAAAA